MKNCQMNLKKESTKTKIENATDIIINTFIIQLSQIK